MSRYHTPGPVAGKDDAEQVLSLTLLRCAPVAAIEVRGEIDMGTVHMLTELVDVVVRKRPERVVLDLARVRFFSAAGLRALLDARGTVAAAGGVLVLRDPSPQVWRVLTITGTDRLFPREPRLSTAASPCATIRRSGASRPRSPEPADP